MAAVRSVYVVNGAPAWISKAARALVMGSGLLKPGTKIEEGVCHADNCPRDEKTRCGDDCEGYCKTWRNGDHEPREHTFSVADAKIANLWSKSGPWKEYPQRMLQHRAAGFHFDDCWQDVLMGLTTVEVLQDHPQAAFIREGEAIVTDATPPGRDPLLPPASGAVVDVEPEEPGETAEGDSSEPSGSESEEPGSSEEEHGVVTCIADVCNSPVEPNGDDDFCLYHRRLIDEQHKEMEAAEKEEKEEKPKKKKAAPKPKKKAAPKGADIQICSVGGCGREFDTDREAHWIRGGLFRCAECGPFPK
jgi:hypothetical protein